MNLADELRTAANKLRRLAGQATPGPWATTWRGQEYQLDGNTKDDLSPIAEWSYAIVTTEPKASEQRAECDTADAEYIAAMHPLVGLALADWLDETARNSEPFGVITTFAVEMARTINGGQP